MPAAPAAGAGPETVRARRNLLRRKAVLHKPTRRQPGRSTRCVARHRQRLRTTGGQTGESRTGTARVPLPAPRPTNRPPPRSRTTRRGTLVRPSPARRRAIVPDHEQAVAGNRLSEPPKSLFELPERIVAVEMIQLDAVIAACRGEAGESWPDTRRPRPATRSIRSLSFGEG